MNDESQKFIASISSFITQPSSFPQAPVPPPGPRIVCSVLSVLQTANFLFFEQDFPRQPRQAADYADIADLRQGEADSSELRNERDRSRNADPRQPNKPRISRIYTDSRHRYRARRTRRNPAGRMRVNLRKHHWPEIAETEPQISQSSRAATK